MGFGFLDRGPLRIVRDNPLLRNDMSTWNRIPVQNRLLAKRPGFTRIDTRRNDMTGILERTLGILEYLAAKPEGAPMASIADAVGIPRSATHRLLAELATCGYVPQTPPQGDSVLTTKLVPMALSQFTRTGTR